MMATAAQVLQMLCPNIEWTSYGESFDDIVWNDGTPAISKSQFEAGFAQWDAWKAEQEAAKQAKRAAAEAKLAALGLTTDDLKALGLS